jgi:hypothetical protein
MDPLRDLEKASSNQNILEGVEIKRNLNLRSIEAINKISTEFIEETLIHTTKLILLIEYFVRCVEHN